MNRVFPALLILAAALVLAGCTSAASRVRPADEAVPVRVAHVVHETLALPVTGTGTLSPKEEASLGFKVGGVVARVLVHEGDRVQAGQLLAALEMPEIDAAVARARLGAEKAERDRQRAERLYADSVVTLEQLQDAGTARDAAKAEYDAAAFNRRYAVIESPAAGVVLRRQVEPGEVVAAGASVLTIGNRARGQVVRMGLSDRDVMRVRMGDPAVVRFDALPERELAGRVSEIGAASDPVTGTYRVEIALPAATGLASGLVGTVEIRPRANESVALVPMESLLEADGRDGAVYTLSSDGRHAERRPVRLAFAAGERVAIRSGLDGVSVVITQGAGRLSPGDRVEVTR
jgi:RND family efflux transporter MFP subunit